MNSIIRDGTLLKWYGDVLKEEVEDVFSKEGKTVSISEDEIKKMLEEAYNEEAGNRKMTWDREKGDWINNPQGFDIQVIAPPKAGDVVTFPWIELRRFDKNNPNLAIVEADVKPLPSEFVFQGKEINIGKRLRHIIIDEMQKSLPRRSFLAGGVGTIDIGTNKYNAWQELISRLNLDPSYVVYFGDEFTLRRGDYPVTQISGVTIFSASLEEGQPQNVFPVGKGPLSIWDLLEQYIWQVNFE